MKDISLGKIAQIAVMVRDLERATAFYRDKLGIPFLFNAPPKMAFFDCDGIRLMLGVPERADLAHAASILYFKVPDIDMAYEALSGRGVVFEGKPTLVAPMPTYDLWLVEFRDSENNVLALMCEKAK
ncbi:MAG: glyoxalase [Verrucomicrobia bacterium]|nr:MAG: glyoxalase [Verrucomicrobiota bacterium]